jgi:release factor glutamine methyltransferase
VLAKLPNAHVTFAELDPTHEETIKCNARTNGIPDDRFDICTGDLFEVLSAHKEGRPTLRFDVIAANPPYVPEGRELDSSVTDFEPSLALFGGADGLDLIRRIAADAPEHLAPEGRLWLECDTHHAERAKELFEATGAHTTLCTDQYGRARYLVSYWSHGD